MVVAKYVVEERGWGVKKAIRSKLQIYIYIYIKFLVGDGRRLSFWFDVLNHGLLFLWYLK